MMCFIQTIAIFVTTDSFLIVQLFVGKTQLFFSSWDLWHKLSFVISLFRHNLSSQILNLSD